MSVLVWVIRARMELGENTALKAFRDAVDVQGAADYLLQNRPDPYALTAPCPEGAGCLCNRIDASRTQTGPVLIAAAGNELGRFCPARAVQTLSIGFMTERRTFENGHQRRFFAPPPYPQSDLLDFAIHHLPGALGSSFAAPLFLAALALRDEARDVYDLLGKAQATEAATLLENLFSSTMRRAS